MTLKNKYARAIKNIHHVMNSDVRNFENNTKIYYIFKLW